MTRIDELEQYGYEMGLDGHTHVPLSHAPRNSDEYDALARGVLRGQNERTDREQRALRRS